MAAGLDQFDPRHPRALLELRMNPAEAGRLLTGSAAVRVKICGLTNPEDTALAVAAGADALGFNFYPGSKRFLDLAQERPWLEQVDARPLRVAVVVNPVFEEALALLAEPFIDALQLHGDEPPEFCRRVLQAQPKPVIKALRVRDQASLDRLGEYDFLPVLLDAFSTTEYGGTGQVFDWSLLEKAANPSRLILSGGLNPENVESAVRFTKLRFLDVASGVERHPRRKSPEKMRNFVIRAQKTGQ